MIKNNYGISLVESIIAIGILAGISLALMSLGDMSTKNAKNNYGRNQLLVASEYIISQTAYYDSCLSSLKTSSTELTDIINNTFGELEIYAPDNSTLKYNTFNPFFNFETNHLKIENISLIKSSFGYKFYSGELKLEMTKNKVTQLNRIGSLTFLMDDLNVIVACSSREDLQEYPPFKALRL